jgi:hypothetical protein
MGGDNNFIPFKFTNFEAGKVRDFVSKLSNSTKAAEIMNWAYANLSPSPIDIAHPESSLVIEDPRQWKSVLGQLKQAMEHSYGYYKNGGSSQIDRISLVDRASELGFDAEYEGLDGGNVVGGLVLIRTR